MMVDHNDVDPARGEVGEIYCRPRYPDVMFTGYWNRPADTLSVFRNLWFHTGDLARIDEDLWSVRGRCL